jgi:hypothetical protein
MMTVPSGEREIATTWEHFRYAPNGDYGTSQGAVSLEFLGKFFLHSWFFLHYPSVLMHFLLHFCFLVTF